MYYSVCVHFKLNVFLYFSFDLSEEIVIQYLEVGLYIFNMNVIIAKGKQSLTGVGLTVYKILIGNYP